MTDDPKQPRGAERGPGGLAARPAHPGEAACDGPRAAAALYDRVYAELRALARRRMADERAGHSLQPTALVHEVYLRLAGSAGTPAWDCRGHFFAAAAEAMRRILVESARRKRAAKRGGGEPPGERVPADQVAAPPLPLLHPDLLALDEALDRLAAAEPAKAQLVELRYFAGLTVPEAAAIMNISVPTAERYWAYARAWLYRALADGDDLVPADLGRAKNPPAG